MDPNDLNYSELIPQHPYRKFIYEKFFSLLKDYYYENYTIYGNLLELDELQRKALNIELGIFNYTLSRIPVEYRNKWNDYFKSFYHQRAVTIYSNLNPKSYLKNINLIKKLFDEEMSEFEITEADAEKIFPEKFYELLEKYGKIDIEVYNKPDLNNIEGILKCGRCKSNKTEYTERQTRSADEPTTKFCYCYNCGNRWRFC